MAGNTANPSRAELRRQQANDRRTLNAAEVLGGPATTQELAPRTSHAAQVMQRAIPLSLVKDGLVTLDPQSQPRIADYDPTLLAPNPQRGRVVDRSLEELAASLDQVGQQEPILARLITETDRARWPTSFTPEQILLILKGHRLFFAQPKTKLAKLRVELLLPQEDEPDVRYGQRALRRASIKMMHSQGYDVFDKVNLYDIWKKEFAIEKPKDSDVAQYFDISRQEAQRLKVVSQLDPVITQEIINADRRPADEVVFHIANRPPEEQREAFEKFGTLTVGQMRKMLAEESTPPAAKVNAAGRPRNYVFAVREDDSEVTYISTSLTAQQWKDKGGAKAFWKAIQALGNSREMQDRIKEDLG